MGTFALCAKSLFMPTLLLSILTPFFLPSSVSLSYFFLAITMQECLRKHSGMSSTLLVAILNWVLFLLKAAAHAQAGKTKVFINCFCNPARTWSLEN